MQNIFLETLKVEKTDNLVYEKLQCKCLNFDNNAVKQGNAEERPDTVCEVKRRRAVTEMLLLVTVKPTLAYIHK